MMSSARDAIVAASPLVDSLAGSGPALVPTLYSIARKRGIRFATAPGIRPRRTGNQRRMAPDRYRLTRKIAMARNRKMNIMTWIPELSGQQAFE
jgi:hypothetical protein